MEVGDRAYSDLGPKLPEPWFEATVEVTLLEHPAGPFECNTRVVSRVQASDKGSVIEAAFTAARDRLRLKMDEPVSPGAGCRPLLADQPAKQPQFEQR